MPKISVVMPVYNGERFIREAIDSLIQQTYEDWELLVVDDGSNDDTLKIVSGYDDQRLKLIRQEHGGEAVARNTGLDHSKGEYIAFLDADDWYAPNALELFSSYLDKEQSFDVVYSDGTKCNVDGNHIKRFSDNRPSSPTGDVLEMFVVYPLHGGVCSTCVRRQLLATYGIRFDERLQLATDWDFFIRLAENAQFGYLDAVTCYYRLHQDSVSAVFPDDRKKFHAKIQLRILSQPYYDRLTLSTKSELFYQLLILWLQGQPDDQRTLVNSHQFQDLPESVRADLLRYVSGNYILTDTNLDFAAECLVEANKLCPSSVKGQLMGRSLNLSPQAARALLSFWKRFHSNATN